MPKKLYLKYGKTLIEEGDTNNKSAYIIERGEVGIFKGGKHICDLGENSIVGEMALITGEPRSATVKSNSDDCTVKEITTEDFRYLWRFQPSALLPVLTLVTERLSSAMDMLSNLQKTLKDR
tara:strand:- start:66 stop:431 length:366 start_codon:yes stop_codon:yes gene_type:complete